ncbi:MAG: hypothetical protein Q9217_006710, partial [Psora testacea]
GVEFSGNGEMLQEESASVKKEIMEQPVARLAVLRHVRSLRGQARREFGMVYSALAPFYEDAVKVQSHTLAKVFRTYRDPEHQAQMLSNLVRFANSDLSEGWSRRREKLAALVAAFEQAVTKQFQQAIAAGDVEGKMRKYAHVLVSLDGGAKGVEMFIDSNPVICERWKFGDPVYSLDGMGDYSFKQSYGFFEKLATAFNEQVVIIDQVFPPSVNAVIPFLQRVGKAVIAEYLTAVFDEAHRTYIESYLRAVSATCGQCLNWAKTLRPTSASSDEFYETLDEVITSIFEPHFEMYLAEELSWFKKKSDAEVSEWQRQLSEQDASMQSMFMSNVNRQADKRDFLTSFKKVVMMPVNVLPTFPMSSPFGGKPATAKALLNGHTLTTTEAGKSQTSTRPSSPDVVNGTASSVNRPATPLPEPPTTELAAKAAIMNSRLEGIRSLFSIEVALSLVHAAKSSIERAFVLTRLGGHFTEDARLQCELIFIALLQTLGTRHINAGLDQAVDHLSNYNPREANEHKQSGVTPLVTFLELVNVGDLIQQMLDVFYEQELVATKLSDRNDFLNPAVKERKRFEQMLDTRVAAGLNKGIEVLMDEVEYVCATTQKAEDFNPSSSTNGNADVLDIGPSETAQRVVDIVSSHTKMLVGSTDKNMLDVFNQEVGMRIFTALCKHLKRQRISVTGSIKLISDMNHYHTYILTLKNKDLLQFFVALRELSQIYLVDPSDAKALAVIIADGERFKGIFRAEEVYEFAERRADWYSIKGKVERAMCGSYLWFFFFYKARHVSVYDTGKEALQAKQPKRPQRWENGCPYVVPWHPMIKRKYKTGEAISVLDKVSLPELTDGSSAGTDAASRMGADSVFEPPNLTSMETDFDEVWEDLRAPLMDFDDLVGSVFLKDNTELRQRQRGCEPCNYAMVKCTRGQPCRRCSSEGYDCSYKTEESLEYIAYKKQKRRWLGPSHPISSAAKIEQRITRPANRGQIAQKIAIYGLWLAETKSEPPAALWQSSSNVECLLQDDESWLDQLKGYFETFTGRDWDWWPLNPRKKMLQPGSNRIRWRCFKACADWRWIDVSPALGRRCSKFRNDLSRSANFGSPDPTPLDSKPRGQASSAPYQGPAPSPGSLAATTNFTAPEKPGSLPSSPPTSEDCRGTDDTMFPTAPTLSIAPRFDYTIASINDQSSAAPRAILSENAEIPPSDALECSTYVRAKFDYQSQDKADFSFCQGDIIEVFRRLKNGWWDGSLDGVRGWFPSNYCESVTDRDLTLAESVSLSNDPNLMQSAIEREDKKSDLGEVADQLIQNRRSASFSKHTADIDPERRTAQQQRTFPIGSLERRSKESGRGRGGYQQAAHAKAGSSTEQTIATTGIQSGPPSSTPLSGSIPSGRISETKWSESSSPTLAQQNERPKSSSDRRTDLYILFCINQSSHIQHTQIHAQKYLHDDAHFINMLRSEYRRLRGLIRYHLSPFIFSHCSFVKYTRFYVNELAHVGPSLPVDPTYVYHPRPPGPHQDPPISPHEFYRRFYSDHCNPCGRGEALERIPKRLNRFQISLHVDGREDMWGLHVELRPSFLRILIWQIAITAGGWIFMAWWLSKGTGDLQGAAVPVTIILSALVVLWVPLWEGLK